MASLGREIVEFEVTLPEKPGKDLMVASYKREKQAVRSLRDYEIK